MKKKFKIIAIATSATLATSVFLGLFFTGMYVCWGPFKGLFWNQEVRRISKKYPAEENQGGVCFYGASNFRLWTQMDQDLNQYHIVNSGFGGSTDRLMVQYADKLLYPYAPKVVFFQTGSNDYVEAKGGEEEKISSCMAYKKEMFDTFHAQLPEAQFVAMSGLLLPGRSQYTSLTNRINEELASYCASSSYLSFVDASALTFDGTSYATNLFNSDGIHLNHEGQLRWCEEYIKPALESVLSEHPELFSVRKK